MSSNSCKCIKSCDSLSIFTEPCLELGENSVEASSSLAVELIRGVPPTLPARSACDYNRIFLTTFFVKSIRVPILLIMSKLVLFRCLRTIIRLSYG